MPTSVFLDAARACRPARLAALTLLLTALAFAACSQEAPPTPDIEARVSAAMEATATAQAGSRTTIDAVRRSNDSGPSSTNSDASPHSNAGNSDTNAASHAHSHSNTDPHPDAGNPDTHIDAHTYAGA